MKNSIAILFIMCCLFIGSSVNGQHKYGEVLQKSMFFYEAQQAGELSPNNRVTWRADAGLTDGQDVGLDLTGGWFDAGDHVKFNFPLAYSVTTLCWGYLQNQEAYVQAGQVEIFKENIKHATDHLLKCHLSDNVLVGQTGEGTEDHKYWVPAEVINIRSERPTYQIDAANPGSDLAGENAAAFAAASMVFADSDPAYSATLLEHAKTLYTFADTYRGKYSDAITVVSDFYNSWSGYQDELVWGAIWLYKATNDADYLTKAEYEYGFIANENQEDVKSYGWTLAWDNKSYGCYVLMSQLVGDDEYKTDAERFLDTWFEDKTTSKGPSFTPTGFPILDQWGSNRYAANTAFLLLEYSDILDNNPEKQTKYRERAKFIMDYMLGDNPQDISYVIGYGDQWPMYPHHRTAHGPWDRNEDTPTETRHTLYGALVGGHKTTDDYDWTDDRGDYIWNEVACDYNSLFQGVAARLYSEYGGDIDPNFPEIETPDGEFLVEAKLNSSGTTHSEYAVWVHNRTAWPARIPSTFQFRVYVDISEGVDAGYSSSDYIISSNNAYVSFTDLIAADAENFIYYTEVTYDADQVIYPGGQGESKREAQIRVRLPYDADASAWDPTNDWSYNGITDGLSATNYIPLYADGALVYGEEPIPAEVIDVTGMSITPQDLALNIGETGSVSASVIPSDATNQGISYSSSDETIATVSSTGIVSGLAEGTVTIVATSDDGGFTAECEVTVSVVDVTGISIEPTELEINLGGSETVSASVLPSNATNQAITYTSSNTDIATVDAYGVVTSVAVGSATITATSVDGGFTAACDVIVSVIEVTGITIDPTSIAMYVGTTSTVSASVIPSNAANQTITYTSSDDAIITVDAEGVVTAIAEGTAVITATSEDGGYTATCEVTVSTIPTYTLTTDTLGLGSIAISPVGGIYEEGTIVNLSATAATGYVFSGWSGDVVSTDASITVTMDDDKSIIATFVPQTTGCSSPIEITLPLVQEGVGEFCWVTSDEIDFINSWNMDKVEINGIDFTNTWANSMPEKIDGTYIIHYVASVPWSHLEVKLGTLKGANQTQKVDLNTNINIYPNPTSDVVSISNLPDATSILVFDSKGNKILEERASEQATHRIDLSAYPTGSYIIKLRNNDVQLKNYIIIKR